MQKRTVSSELVQAHIAIENALSHEPILKKLAAFNYNQKRMLEGKVLKEELEMLESVKQDKYGQQFSSTDSIYAQQKEIMQRYKQHCKRARMAFEGQRGILEQLQLPGKRKGDFHGLMGQIKAFYTKIEQYAEQVSKFNISPEEVAQTKAMLEALSAARLQQQQSKGEAQHATHQRDAKRKELRKWMSQFRKVARIALADEPQLLESLGILVPTQKV
ncbi:hypothetical protein WJR50_11160 [Catalinimonas sp. 4WD22]|uniref:hypothetical protein n=1 Tax=Catalinimonas locisalis TaxID=3133978 RepID=UPI003100CC54